MFTFSIARARTAAIAVGMGAALLAALPAYADRQPNTNVGAGERSAYESAIADGSPAALRRYIESYPETPQAARLLQVLIEDCAKRLQASGGKKNGNDPACDLSELIAPAAGTQFTTTYQDPPTENSNGRRASPN
jgi:hypothetical protein